MASPLRGIFASTPGASDYLLEDFRPLGVKGNPVPGRRTFPVPTLSNPYLRQEPIDAIAQRYPEGPQTRKANIMGDWRAFEGQLITNFDSVRHVAPDADKVLVSRRTVRTEIKIPFVALRHRLPASH